MTKIPINRKENEEDEPERENPMLDDVRHDADDGAAPVADDPRYVRLMADFENFRKRTDRDLAQREDAGKRALALDLLPVIDALDNGLESGGASATQDWIDGMTALQTALLDALRRHGIERIEAAGRPFDPHLHEGVAIVHTDELPPDHVYDVMRHGYMFKDDVLRPAQVRVTSE